MFGNLPGWLSGDSSSIVSCLERRGGSSPSLGSKNAKVEGSSPVSGSI